MTRIPLSASVLLVVLWLVLPPCAAAQDEITLPVPWSEVAEPEQEAVERLLGTHHWPLRAFCLLRLERYVGEEVNAMVLDLIEDPAWQVRCFAIDHAWRRGLAIDPELLNREDEPRVVRTALRCGVAIDQSRAARGAKRLMGMRNVDSLMLGIEIAAALKIEPLRAEATERAVRMIRNMDDSITLRFSRRLAAVFGVQPVPLNREEWHVWLANRGEDVQLASPDSFRRPPPEQQFSRVAQLTGQMFSRLLDYLSALKQRDLEMVIVMDSTSSMLPLINEARVRVDALILFLRDISRTMRLGFIAYRDYDNEPVWEGERLTENIDAIRDFLFSVRITGGADFPEAVYEGVNACNELEWSPRAEKMIMVIGDAPPRQEDVDKLMGAVATFRNRGISVHTVCVPHDPESPWGMEFNEQTADIFAEMAKTGGGERTVLDEPHELVLSLIRSTLDEAWWPVFDEFYERYLDLCR